MRRGKLHGKISDSEQSFELSSGVLSSGNTPEHGKTGEEVAGLSVQLLMPEMAS